MEISRDISDIQYKNDGDIEVHHASVKDYNSDLLVLVYSPDKICEILMVIWNLYSRLQSASNEVNRNEIIAIRYWGSLLTTVTLFGPFSEN